MTNNVRVALILVVLAVLSGPIARAQQAAPDGSQKAVAERASPALQLQFVLSKYHNDKKISSRPYIVIMSGRDIATGRLHVGNRVPVPAAPASASQQMFNYQNVGTTIVCSAQPLESGLFRLDVDIDDSSIQKNTDTTINAPIFQSFQIRGGPVMKDGQTTQLSSATDPVSGEVMKVDVTLTVVK